MNRRRFLLGAFVLGCATALGVRPQAPKLYRFNETDYLKTEPFRLRGVDGNYASVPESVYFTAKDDIDWLIVPRGDRLGIVDLGQSEK